MCGLFIVSLPSHLKLNVPNFCLSLKQLNLGLPGGTLAYLSQNTLNMCFYWARYDP